MTVRDYLSRKKRSLILRLSMVPLPLFVIFESVFDSKWLTIFFVLTVSAVAYALMGLRIKCPVCNGKSRICFPGTGRYSKFQKAHCGVRDATLRSMLSFRLICIEKLALSYIRECACYVAQRCEPTCFFQMPTEINFFQPHRRNARR